MSSGDYLKDIDNVRNEAIKRERMINHSDNLTGLELAKIAMALEHLKKENKQLREALCEADPHGDGRRCYKCDELFPDHAVNCKYIKLTK
jgi:hypothetical protein